MKVFGRYQAFHCGTMRPELGSEMPFFTLKHYRRQIPEGSTAGMLICEWGFEANTVADAVQLIQTQFSQGYDERTDFQILWDDDGKHVWGTMNEA